MRYRPLLFALSAFVALFVFSIISPIVLAQQGSVGVNPAFVDIVVPADSGNASFELEYENNSNTIVELAIEMIDFKGAQNGAIVLSGQESGSFSYALASFLSPETSTIILEPGTKKKLKVLVRNRQGLSPGGHYAAVIARMVSSKKAASQKARVEPSLSSLVLLRKEGGERFNLSLSRASWPAGTIVFSIPRTIELTFLNEGNVHLIPYGTAQVKDMFGRVTHQGVLNESSLRIFPETRRFIAADLKRVDWFAPMGLYVFDIRGSDSLRKTKYIFSETFVYIEPWFFVPLFVVIIAGILIWKRQKKLRKKRSS